MIERTLIWTIVVIFLVTQIQALLVLRCTTPYYVALRGATSVAGATGNTSTTSIVGMTSTTSTICTTASTTRTTWKSGSRDSFSYSNIFLSTSKRFLRLVRGSLD